MRLILCYGLLLWPFISRAASGPTITGVNGASGFLGTGTPTIMAGLAGDAVTGPDENTPGNSCALQPQCLTKPLCPCNTARVYNNLILTINLSNQTTDANGATTTATGNAYVTLSTSGSSGGTTTTPATSNQPVTLISNNNGGTSVAMRWQVLCSQAGLGSCEDAANGATFTLNIYRDANNNGTDSTDAYTTVTVKFLKPDPDTYATYGSKNNQGIGTFTPYPGDGKIYIRNPETTADFPYLNYNSVIKGVRVFLSENNLVDANPQSASSTRDLAVSDDGQSLSKNIVDGLTNGTRYFVRLAMLDEAQNVVMFTPDPAVDGEANTAECKTPSGSTSGGCKYSAIPERVEGLLPDDFNCFIATAAYGSFLEPKLKTFREFRRRILLTTEIGRRVNLWYYRFGPYAARFLQDRPAWRAATRIALWPAFGFSWVALRLGFNATAFPLLAMIGLSYLAIKRKFGARG